MKAEFTSIASRSIVSIDSRRVASVRSIPDLTGQPVTEIHLLDGSKERVEGTAIDALVSLDLTPYRLEEHDGDSAIYPNLYFVDDISATGDSAFCVRLTNRCGVFVVRPNGGLSTLLSEFERA